MGRTNLPHDGDGGGGRQHARKARGGIYDNTTQAWIDAALLLHNNCDLMRRNAQFNQAENSPARAVDVRRARDAFDIFYDKYDSLIGLLCLAAREGVASEHERQYQEVRGWFIKRYQAYKAPLGRYLTTDASDAYFRKSDRILCDAFEAMFLPPTISSMFESDGGKLIERMLRTQHALGSWDDAIATAEIECRLQVVPSEFRQPSLAAL